ncbi:hypothetical protein NEDG_02250 [Nematocida displodere]|uniref:Uncharacterized protein n=1 Tax=Nematocida displodere TaxID=1805483 RepID=A0A177EAZ2_9MICR|nr:hypothetical protein NEDG_01252 [Nematocida displodere]OAG30262.1 hypothetical protein NEDG_02251 [Nematocida displodere]OAG30432.1 hypothetical protein NEDG_02250 [Nematocida displodere]
MQQPKMYIWAIYGTIAVGILAGIVACSVYLCVSWRTAQGLENTSRHAPGKDRPTALPQCVDAPQPARYLHLYPKAHIASPSSSPNPCPNPPEAPAVVAGSPAEKPTPTIPRSSLTEPTIAFFKRAGNGNGQGPGSLQTLTRTHGLEIVRNQNAVVVIHLKNLEAKDIPEQIERGIVFRWLSVSGTAVPGIGNFTPRKELGVLAKLLQTVSSVRIGTLYIDCGNIHRVSIGRGNMGRGSGLAGTTPNTISLPNIKALSLFWASSSFLEWLCETVDLSASTESISVNIYNCEITSIKCLDNLGIQRPHVLRLESLPYLEQLDGQLVVSICSNGPPCALWLDSLPSLTHLSKDLADVLARTSPNTEGTEGSTQGLCISNEGLRLLHGLLPGTPGSG